MPPTDCFDVSDSGRASLPPCGSEAQLQLLPTTRSPLHHGTDPDLSAPTPLPGGVALADLDLSPMTAGHCTLAVLGKTKNKSHMTAALMSSKPISLSRSLPQGVIKAEYSANKQPIVHERSGELGHHHQQSRQITKFAPHSPAVHSSLLRSGAENQRAASTQLRNIPAGNDDKHPTEFENAGITDNTAGSRPSELQHLGSPRPGTVKQGVRVAVVAEDGQLEEAKKHQQDQQQQKTGSGTGASLDTIMAKAKIAAENIRLLLHAKRCDNPCCKEPGCASAKQLVEHMRSCGASVGKPCGDVKCRKAQKILLHYAECSRRRALGGRYCLVCSLVARSPGGGQTRGNSNVMSSPRSTLQGRQPLSRMTTLSARGRSHISRSYRDSSGLQPPVTIARFKWGDRMRGTPASASSGMGRFVKDGAFFRPLPKARSGSWGGYDRRRCMRRTRIDSIPEEQTDEEDEEDDNDKQGEPSSENGSKTSDDVSRSKTLVSSLSL